MTNLECATYVLIEWKTVFLKNEQTQQKIEDLIKNKLNIALNSCNRLDKFSPNKQRVTLSRFRSVTEKNLCLRSSGKLKRRNIFLNEDILNEDIYFCAKKQSLFEIIKFQN